jgi:alkanesulfonate monooxygenase SsuD/methylene tetrahydromethanopterin reductase-like flavin-dependent oxidoreductase (luciferase family)
MEYLTDLVTTVPEGTTTAKVDEPKPIQKPHIPIYLGGFSPQYLQES